ncbi:hypothetical protein BAE44_0023393 [Dichanthelium oligosanthes]|uniref:F-box associated beta-propeller type 3 domain-containing protein n=1 Tax=Dichanthelium oligosanthes TaxID=888268 RepID=A0A1E5URV5_9POAL|nr:hypothetical protein BAE44_0023393 [Dichanthelium oligosanthes]
MIGTCNGLLCLLRPNERHDIVVIKPVTREAIAVDLPSTWYYGRNEATYSFGYHPATGQYKIVHVPSYEPARLDAVRVLTLGDDDGPGAWREVPAPAGSSCFLRFGLVSVGGVTYWVTEDAERIMSFDLMDERVAPVESPPMPVSLVPMKVQLPAVPSR